MKNIIRQSLCIIQENPESYLLTNFFYYSIFVAGLIYANIHPNVHETFRSLLQNGNRYGLQSIVHNAYFVNRSVLLAILLTFFINVVLGAGIHISLSSLVVPFVGCFIAAGRAFLWGLTFGSKFIMAKPIILVLIALEGQGYVLAAFGAYLQGARFLRPRGFNLSSHKEGFLEGVKLSFRIYPLIIIVLLISAFFEVFISGTMPQNPFSNLADPKFRLHASGSNAFVDFQGLSISYDSAKVKLSDAKIAAVALQDVGYTGSIAVSRESLSYQIRISLPLESWKNPEVVRRLGAAVASLRQPFLNRHYEIVACSEDSLGNLRENVLLQQ